MVRVMYWDGDNEVHTDFSNPWGHSCTALVLGFGDAEEIPTLGQVKSYSKFLGRVFGSCVRCPERLDQRN